MLHLIKEDRRMEIRDRKTKGSRGSKMASLTPGRKERNSVPVPETAKCPRSGRNPAS